MASHLAHYRLLKTNLATAANRDDVRANHELSTLINSTLRMHRGHPNIASIDNALLEVKKFLEPIPEPNEIRHRPDGLVAYEYNGHYTPFQITRCVASIEHNHPGVRVSVVVRFANDGHIVTIPMSDIWFDNAEHTWMARTTDGQTSAITIISFYTGYFEFRGSCDTNHHRVVHYGAFKILTLKSKNHCCLVAAFAYHCHDKSKHKSIVNGLTLSKGPKFNSDIDKLVTYYNLYARLWAASNTPVTPINTFGDVSKTIIDLLYQNNHYYYIIAGAPASSNIATQYINRENALGKLSNAERRSVFDTINDDRTDDFTHIVDKIVASNDHWVIDGGAGTGKSYLCELISNRLGARRVMISATTGVAAKRLGGITIDKLLKLGSYHTPTYDSLIIDEMSMCDGRKMDHIVQFALQHSIRLILSGDDLQLPPVKEKMRGRFFQSDLLSALHLHRVALTKVRRTNNVQYANLCSRVRVGQPTPEDIAFLESRFVENANPRNYQLYIASRNREVDEYNLEVFSQLQGHTFQYKPIFKTRGELDEDRVNKILDKASIVLKKGARILATRNSCSYSNGSLGTIIECYPEYVLVHFDEHFEGINTSVVPVSNATYRHKDIEYLSIPLRLAYALTIHKSQGMTCHVPMLFKCDDSWTLPGMYYTAITRVSDPNFLTISGVKTPTPKMYAPSKIVMKFLAGEYVPTLAEKYLEKDKDMDYYHETMRSFEPLDSSKRRSHEPSSVYYFDFETAETTAESKIEPYLNTWSLCEGNPFQVTKRGVQSDILGHESYGNQKVALRVLKEHIIPMMMKFEADIKRKISIVTRDDEDKVYKRQVKNIRKYASTHCPRFCAFNGSNFDLYFLSELLINNSGSLIDSTKYSMCPILKGSSLVSFTILSKDTYSVILRCHDLCQIVGMSLKDACDNFLSKDDPDNNKIEFKHQIMDLSAKRYHAFKNKPWSEWIKPEEIEVHDFPSDITEQEKRLITSKRITYKPSDVIEYAMRDTDLLPKLYQSVDKVVRDITGCSVFTFLTLGGMTWYCSTQRMLKSISLIKRGKKKQLNLYGNNRTEEDFIRKSIYGGRACPRVIYSSDVVPGNHVYVDFSSMYGSILLRCEFPHGIISWVPNTMFDNYLNQIRDFAKSKTLSEFAKDSSVPVYFIAEIEFEEGNNLEPVIPQKTQHGTRYLLGKRKEVITSVDLALILILGGKYYTCNEMLHFADHGKFMSEWSQECLEGKQKHKGTALGNMFKTLNNANYGQTMKRDHTSQSKIVSRPEETMDFLQKYDWKYFIVGRGDYDVLFGDLKETAANFITTRAPYIGAFVLAYSRVMLQNVVHIVNPNNDPRMQPIMGDTDSLLVSLEGALRLREAGLFPDGGAQPGQLTDELADTIDKKGFISKIEVTINGTKKMIPSPEYKGKFFLVTRWFSPAPKILAIEFVDPVTKRHFYKFRCKGIAVNSQISSEGEIMSAGALFAYLPTYIKETEQGKSSIGITAQLPQGLKRIAPGSVPLYDRIDSTSLMTIHINTMVRHFLENRWDGRQYIGNGITVPHGWK
jgi:hypothetical protein